MHEFVHSCLVEDLWAPVLDAWLSRRYQMRPASLNEQRRGIDRFLTDENGRSFGVDYKCDEVAGKTGNLFIELVSNATTGRLGWVFTSAAEWICYFVVPDLVLSFRTSWLRPLAGIWRHEFPVKGAVNHRGAQRYTTLGVCVPIDIAAEVADSVVHLRQADDEREAHP